MPQTLLPLTDRVSFYGFSLLAHDTVRKKIREEGGVFEADITEILYCDFQRLAQTLQMLLAARKRCETRFPFLF